MLKITALNYDNDSVGCENEQVNITKEAQEDQALQLYKEALKLQNQNNYDKAYELLLQLLQYEVLNEVSCHSSGTTQPLVGLKYSCYKNLAQIALILGKEEEGLNHFLDALSIDPGDVTVWYKAGNLSKKLNNFSLARSAYVGGLQANPRHWPCLHEVITILYVLSDYFNCLIYISEGLKRDSGYLNGLVFRDQIFKEDPNLESLIKSVIGNDDPLFTEVDYDFNKHSALIDEAHILRKLKLQQYSEEGDIQKKVIKPDHITLNHFTWVSLGAFILELYSYISNSKIYTVTCPIDLTTISLNLKESEPKDSVGIESSKIQAPLDSNNTHLDNPAEDYATEDKINSIQGGLDISDLEVKEPENENNQLSIQCQQTENAENPFMSEFDNAIAETEGQVKKTAKRKKNLAAEFYYFGEVKRRSSRVRSQAVKPAAKPEEETDYALCLLKLIPASLSQVSCKDCDTDMGSSDTGDTRPYQMKGESRECVDLEQKKEEEKEVISFLSNVSQMTEHCSIIRIMNLFIMSVAKVDSKWSKDLHKKFVEVFITLRKHCPYPTLPKAEENDPVVLKNLSDNAFAALIFVEVRAIEMKLSSQSCDQFVDDALLYLMELVTSEVWAKGSKEVQIRLLWIEALLACCCNNSNIQLRQLRQLQLIFQEDSVDIVKLSLPHDPFSGTLTCKMIDQLIDTLERNCNAERVLDMYNEGDYDGVVDSLTSSFYKSHECTGDTSSVLSRLRQLEIFIDSLVHKGNIKNNLKWYQKTLEEAIKSYTSCETGDEKERWICIISTVVMALELCTGVDIIRCQDKQLLGLLCQNMMQIVLINLTASESMLIDSFFPWIMLHQLISWEEESDRSSTQIGSLPSSLQYLVTSHDWVGRRSWCCNKDGQFILYIMDVLLQYIDNNCGGVVPETLRVGIEQCIYCLYGHPSKKSKVRHLQEHAVNSIVLTWERAISVFRFFRPPELPEYDSYRIVSISPETESLLKKIISLVPDSPVLRERRESIKNYILGKEDNFPVLQAYTVSSVVADIYYLIADFSFKNKDWEKAAEYYELDVSVNPERVDSWAGLALAQTGQLETILNSCQSVKKDSSIYDSVSSVLKCFRRTLDLQPKLTKMWIEYGSFAYMMHSFASRQLKQETLDLTMSMLSIVEKHRESLLEVAHYCFTMAYKISTESTEVTEEQGGYYDERWLHQYMLGKIAEKQCKQAQEILTHYEKASRFIHEAGAKYPRKLNYHNPQLLSVEALEIYYRMHAWILKHVLKHESSPISHEEKTIIVKVLDDVARGPFFDGGTKTGNKEEPDELMNNAELTLSRKRANSMKAEKIPPEKRKRNDVNVESCVPFIMKELLDIVCEKLEAENNRNKSIESNNSENAFSKDMEVSNEVNQLKGEAVNPQSVPTKDSMEVEVIDLEEEDDNMTLDSSQEPVAATQAPIPTVSPSSRSSSVPSQLNTSPAYVSQPADGETSSSGIAFIPSSPLSHIPDTSASNQAASLSPSKSLVLTKSPEAFLSPPTSLDGSNLGDFVEQDPVARPPSVKKSFTSDFQKAFENALLSSCFNSESDEDMEEKPPLDEPLGGVNRSPVRTLATTCEETLKEEKMEESMPSNESKSGVNHSECAQEVKRESDGGISVSPSTETTAFSLLDGDLGNNEPPRVSPEVTPNPVDASAATPTPSSIAISSTQPTVAVSAPTKSFSPVKTSSEKECVVSVVAATTVSPCASKDSEVRMSEGHNTESPQKVGYNKEIIDRCLAALQECLHRFPHHYKSLYRIVHYYYVSKYNRNIKWCRDMMLGVPSNWNRFKHMSTPGLFFERKKTNFFNGVWRIPSNDVDRPGSFAAHMYRCVALLIDILQDIHDSHTLVNLLIHMDHRPDADKTYLYESMRLLLVEHGYKVLIKILRHKANSRKNGNATSLTTALLDIYRVYQKISKHMPTRTEIGTILETCYNHYVQKFSENKDKHSLEQAIKYCEKLSSHPAGTPLPAKTDQAAPPRPKPRGRPPSQSQMPAFSDLSLLSSIAAAQAQMGKLTGPFSKLDAKKTMGSMPSMGMLPDFNKFLSSELSAFASGYQADYFNTLYQSMLTSASKDKYFSDVSLIPVGKSDGQISSKASNKSLQKGGQIKSPGKLNLPVSLSKTSLQVSQNKLEETVLIKTSASKGQITSVPSCLPTSIANKIPQSISVLKTKPHTSPGSSVTISKVSDLSGRPPPAHQSSKKSSFVAFPVSDKAQYPHPPIAHGSSLSSIAKLGQGALGASLSKRLDIIPRGDKLGKPSLGPSVSGGTTITKITHARPLTQNIEPKKPLDPFKNLKASLSDPKQALFSNKNISIEVIVKEDVHPSNPAKDSSHMLPTSIEMIPIGSKVSKKVLPTPPGNAMTITPTGGPSQVIELGKTSAFLKSVIGHLDKPVKAIDFDGKLPGISVMKTSNSEVKSRQQRPSVINSPGSKPPSVTIEQTHSKSSGGSKPTPQYK